MSTQYFINTQTFDVFLHNTNGGTASIENTFLGNLYKLWCIPFAAGGALFELTESEQGVDYGESLGLERHNKTGFSANGFLLTVEPVDGQEQLVIYGINLRVESSEVNDFGADLNPQISSNGDNSLFKAVGGSADQIQGGTSWQVVDSAGYVKDENKNDIKDTVVFSDETDQNEELKFPMPLVLFNRADMA